MTTRVATFLLSGVLVLAAAGNANAQEPEHFVPGRVLVKFKRSVPDSEAHSAFSRLRARASRKIEGISVHIVELPEGESEAQYAVALRSRDDVEFAELDRLVQVSDVTPNDPMFADAWHLSRVAAPAAWSITTGSSNVTVAVLDTGVDGTHPDLAAKMVPGWNFYNNNSDTADVYGHGTKTAGTIAAISNNGAGVASLCWGCKIMPLRISDASGWGSYSAMSSALVWAADRGVKVANLSFAIDSSAAITSAASYFASKGGILAVSAGNAGAIDSASDNPNMLRVSATDPNDALYGWSNTGNNIDLSAPGCVVTTMRGGGYGSGCGTSYSAPVVSGVAALVFSVKPNATPAEVTSILRQTADEAGPAGWDPTYGWGRVNASRAVTLAANGTTPDAQAPIVSFNSPANGSTVSGAVAVQGAATDNVGVTSVTLSVDGVYRTAWTAAPYNYSLDTTALSNGAHTLSIYARDAANNGATATVQVTVSNTSPDTQAPAVSFTTPASGATVSGAVSVQLSASDNVAVTSVVLAIDGVNKATWTASPYSYTWNTSGVSNGLHTLSATATDAAGNTKTLARQVTVNNTTPDTQAPSVSFTAPLAGSTVTGAVAVQVSASDNIGVSSVTLYVNGGAVTTWTTAPYNFSWNTAGLNNGAYTLTATSNDAAGNSSTTSVAVTVSNTAPDSQAPALSFTTPSNGASVSGTVTVQLAASDNVGVAQVTLTVNGAPAASWSAGPYAYSWNTSALANGTYTLAATARDAANNSASRSIQVTVNNTSADTQAPTVAISNPLSGSTVAGTVSVQMSATDNVAVASITLSSNGSAMSSWTTAASTYSWNTTVLPNGVHTLTATAADTAGNTSSTSVQVTVNNPPAPDTIAPVVRITSPASGGRLGAVSRVTVAATDNVRVTAVELYMDGVLVSRSTSAPFTLTVKHAGSGSHVLQVKAYDAAGNVGISAPVSVYR